MEEIWLQAAELTTVKFECCQLRKWSGEGCGAFLIAFEEVGAAPWVPPEHASYAAREILAVVTAGFQISYIWRLQAM